MTVVEDDPLRRVEAAIAALGRADADSARATMAAAVAADRSLAPLADAMALATSELEREGRISSTAWDVLADACPKAVRDSIEVWRR